MDRLRLRRVEIRRRTEPATTRPQQAAVTSFGARACPGKRIWENRRLAALNPDAKPHLFNRVRRYTESGNVSPRQMGFTSAVEVQLSGRSR